jgi:hypothetical protein
MREMLMICLQSPKHKCNYILPDFTLMLLFIQFKNIFKRCTGAFLAVFCLCAFFVGLLTMLLHHTLLAEKFHELLFMSSCTICPCFWMSPSLSQLASSIGCPFHFTRYSKCVFLWVFLPIL